MLPGAGTQIGPYQIVEAIGAGGRGRVFRARDTRLHREVALKFLHETGGTDATARLLREARAASQLNHPHICQIYDVGESEHGPWIAMEYVPGDRLDARIPNAGLPYEDAVRIAAEIAGALAHAHQRGIVHRDLKTSNCVWGTDGAIKVLDFGLASRTPERMAEEATRSGSVSIEGPAGTPAYMAPEVLRGGRGDARSDLWALGVVLYELVAGSRPFSAPSIYELASAILSTDPPPLPAGVPEGFRYVVARLLRRNPEDRYQSAEQVQVALEALRAGGRDAVAAARRRPPMTRRGLVLGSFVAAALVAGGIWWWVARDRTLALSDVELLSTFEGSHTAPSLARDGSRVAFIAPDGSGVPQVWIKNLKEGEPYQVTSGPVPADRPRWHPDGRGIVFARRGEGVWFVPELGGSPRRIAERGANPGFSSNGERLTWETPEGIWIARADGTEARAVGGVPERYYSLPRMPALSPDGSRIAFFHPETGPNGDLWVIASQGGEPRRLTTDLREGGAPVWTPDGRHIIFASARAGSQTLWQISAEGGDPQPLTTGAGEDDFPDISADGTRLVFTNTRNAWEIRMADASGREQPLLQRRSELLFPMFSPDASRIAFFGRAGAAVAIFTMARDGADLRQLTGGTELNHQPRWAPDGASVYFYQVRPAPGLRRVSVLGGPSEQAFPWTWEMQNAVQFGPDGDRLVYTRLHPPGHKSTRPEVTVVQAIATGDEIELPGPHLHHPRFSRDGRFIAGSGHDGIAVCDTERRGCRIVVAMTQLSIVTWSPDDSRLFYLRVLPRNPLQELWSVRTDGTDPRKLHDLGPFRSIDRFFDVSISGDLVWAPSQLGRSELWTAAIR